MRPTRSSIKTAFTLAEVLITLAIIGVVAAMTIPTLIQSYQEKVTVTRLKKVYSVLSQAYQMAENDYGTPDEWPIEAGSSGEQSAAAVDILAQYIKNTKKCDMAKSTKGCFADGSYKRLDGNLYGPVDERTDMVRFVTADGVAVALSFYNKNCDLFRENAPGWSNICGWFIADINGPKKPNTYGIDTFEFVFSKAGILLYGAKQDSRYPFPSNCNPVTGISNGCTAWVVVNENLDYLHCDDLSWDGKKTCN